MRKILALTLVLTALTACAAPMVRAPENGESAVYVLSSVDGRALPYLESEGSSIARGELSEGMLQLRANGTFFMDLTWFINSAGTGQRRGGRFYEGMWTRQGEYIDFEFDTGAISRGRIVEGAIVFELDGRTYRWVM